MNEKNLENINQIDMSFSGYDDDDSMIIRDEDYNINENSNSGAVKTGIIINFNDDDINNSMRKHSSSQTIEIPRQNKKSFTVDEMKAYNEIDMECRYFDDTEDDYNFTSKPSIKSSMFEDDDLDSKELVLEKPVTKPAKKVNVDDIEEDFWKQLSKKFNNTEQNMEENLSPIEEKKNNLKNQLRDLQKKHQKTIKKGAYGNETFHFAGDPEKSREIFNHGIGNHTSEVSGNDNNSFEDIIGNSFIGSEGNIADTSVATVASGGEGSGEGVGESLNSSNYTKILKEVFDTIGFKVVKNSDGTLLAKDLCNTSNMIKTNNISELIYELQPFIETCIIIPLSIYTKEKFNDYKAWCDWYTEENRIKYPKYANEIKYCDLLANHLDECEI